MLIEGTVYRTVCRINISPTSAAPDRAPSDIRKETEIAKPLHDVNKVHVFVNASWDAGCSCIIHIHLQTAPKCITFNDHQ